MLNKDKFDPKNKVVTQNALWEFQMYHGLPLGKLNRETIEFMAKLPY